MILFRGKQFGISFTLLSLCIIKLVKLLSYFIKENLHKILKKTMFRKQEKKE